MIYVMLTQKCRHAFYCLKVLFLTQFVHLRSETSRIYTGRWQIIPNGRRQRTDDLPREANDFVRDSVTQKCRYEAGNCIRKFCV